MAGFVVRDNSLSVAEAVASGNGVTTPCESPVGRRTGGRLKRVCILDEGQIRLARKQPIHCTYSPVPCATYTTCPYRSVHPGGAAEELAFLKD